MLRRLHLTNFRRHADTELLFTPDSQVIAITGANGAGKTTILEALTYALYGESRHGRRNLARLVRRGAEFEGMQVELSFCVGDVDYDLVRRYDRGKTSATLMANSNLVMQSADGVTAEVTKILGMDSTGFRLAVIAQQFEIDGLADLRPAQRRTTVTRLLRQDAITRAKVAAANEKNRHVDVVRAMGTGPDLEALEAEVSRTQQDLDATREALTESEAALTELDAQLGRTAATQVAWQEAQVALARAEATVTAHTAQVDRLQAELAHIHVPDMPATPQMPLARITAQLSEVSIDVARAEAGAELARTAESTRADLARVEVALASVVERLGGDTPASLAMALTEADGALAAAAARLDQARADHTAAVETRAGVSADLAALQARAKAEGALGDTCDTCGQSITAAHRKRQAAERKAAIADLTERVAQATDSVTAAAGGVTAAEEALAAARGARDELAMRRHAVAGLREEREDLMRRRETYTQRLERIQVPEVDLEALYARRGELELAKAEAEQYEALLVAREGALERSGRVAEALAHAQGLAKAARDEVESVRPTAELVAAYGEAVAVREARDAEAEMVAAVRVEVAGAEERLNSAIRARAAARAQAARLQEVRAGADRAAKAARLLDVVAERMATQIRPALEGAISDALTRLSEGRFTSVRLSDTYDITVLDDEEYQPLSELSGGERVLVALATRLALAEVVAGRHADGGLRVLVLDEIFGSQDAERREAIMSALRAMRGHYGQILLISHVGGMEDEADHVIDVSTGLVDGSRVAHTTAA